MNRHQPTRDSLWILKHDFLQRPVISTQNVLLHIHLIAIWSFFIILSEIHGKKQQGGVGDEFVSASHFIKVQNPLKGEGGKNVCFQLKKQPQHQYTQSLEKQQQHHI